MTATDSGTAAGRAAHVDLIERLLAPIDRTTFLERHWERERLHVARDDERWFADLFGVNELDRLLSDVRLPATNVDLAQDSTPLPKSSYTVDGFVDLPSLLALHAEGATIILRALEQWCRPLDDLTRAATGTFGTTSQINVYATPPANQSTPPHWDTHDLFILQVHGEKVWNLYDADHELPLEDERFDASTFSVGPLREKVLLRPGDVLYLPRGAIHEPQADTYSIHVSLGLMVTRLADVLVEMVRLAAHHVPELRRGLPPALAGVPQADVEALLVDAMRQLASREVADVVLRHREVAVASAKPDVTGWLHALAAPAAITDDTVVARRAGVAPFVVDAADGPRLRWLRESLPLPDAALGAFLEARERFAVRDLPVAAEERARLVEQLVRAGLLVVERAT